MTARVGSLSGIALDFPRSLSNAAHQKSVPPSVCRDYQQEKQVFSIVALTVVASGVIGAGLLKENIKKKAIPFLSSYKIGKKAPNKIQQDKIAPPVVDSREQQLADLSSLVGRKKEISEAEKEVNQGLKTLSISLAFATAGTLFYPPLILLSIPGLVYRIIPLCQKGYRVFLKDRRFSMATLDAIAVPAILFTGNYLAASLACTLIYLAEKLKIKTRDLSEKSLTGIFEQQSRFVWVIRNEAEVEIPFDALEIGDTVVINAGQMIPIDGIITEGYASIDQRILTGESQPAEKEVGNEVFASTIVIEGRIFIRVEKLGSETVAAQIGNILRNTTDFKSGVQLKGEEFADKSALALFSLGLFALPVAGPSSALAVLNAPLVGTLRMAAPLSVLNFLQIASRQSILVKDGRALELLSKVDTIIFDKTGTLTQEQPHVGALYTCSYLEENELLSYAAAAECKQTHPIAKAILKESSIRELSLPEIEEAKYEMGYGLEVILNQKVVLVGSKRFIERSGIAIPQEIRFKQEYCNENGYSLIYVAIDGELAGGIELCPTIRPEVKHVVSELQKRGFTIYIISGDHEEPTKKLAEKVGIEHYFAETLPENKADLISELQKEGKAVCFVGDGINDSIALKKANVSVSLRGASTIAMDTAGIILMNENLNQLVQLFDLAESLNTNMKANLVITTVPGVICVTGAFFFHFGILSAILLYNVGLVAGVGNAMLPLINEKKRD